MLSTDGLNMSSKLTNFISELIIIIYYYYFVFFISKPCLCESKHFLSGPDILPLRAFIPRGLKIRQKKIMDSGKVLFSIAKNMFGGILYKFDYMEAI